MLYNVKKVKEVIYKSTFNMNTTQYKELKGINKTKRNIRSYNK